MTEEMRIVIVGHVDHGKSTLIGRLLYDTNSLTEEKLAEIKESSKELGRDIEFGFVLDALQEERDQGVTIDTTQVFFKSKKRNYIIIDAPGHKEFLKNMITGASQANAAILIVDANEGIKEQTKRHAYILSLFGIKNIVVVINKMDLVGYKKEVFDSISAELKLFLEKLQIVPSFIIPTSAMKGDTIVNKSNDLSWYTNETVLEALDVFEVPERSNKVLARFPVQDVYKVDDRRILVGRVEAGQLNDGDEILFLPSEKKTKIKSIEAFNEDKSSAFPGECIGINLEDPLFVERGEIACHPNENLPVVKDTLEVNLFWMTKIPLKKGEKTTIKINTQERDCVVGNITNKLDSSSLELIQGNEDELENTQVAKVQLKMNEPIVFDKFNDIPEMGRVVITKNGDIAGGGLIK
tara:strand:+ start:4732 stop:5958 length:1227 start_codon:yes stop_codon:yes gene_type:complete